ncbi:MAG: transporter substrate-binding domain-containing protein [Planctomycetota bacterium]
MAVKEAPPFAYKTSDGSWTGVSVELWNQVAASLGIESEFVELTNEELLVGVAEGEYVAGVAALTVTPEREAEIDFTHAFYTSGLGIAVPADAGRLSFLRAMESLISPAFLSAIAGLTVLLLVIGFVMWLAERKHNPEQFGGKGVEGLANGFWFSAVTMTTVGYGDKSPVSLPGRLVALVWMFASIIVISFFTGAIASAFTASQLTGGVRGPEDLSGSVVGAVRNTVGATRLSSRSVRATMFDSVEDGLAAVAAGELDAFVHDAPLLRYEVATGKARGIRVLEATFDRQAYAIALPPDDPRRERVNVELLEAINSDDWNDLVDRYLSGG